jgi:hypothetical protein
LFALLTEEKFVFDTAYNAPDFACSGLLQDIFIEVVTVGPTRSGNLDVEPPTPDDLVGMREYLSQYMPIKWAGPLTAKLQKRYWNLPHVAGKPVVLAVQDFHLPRAMTFTSSTLLPYLYGRSFTSIYDCEGKLHVRSARIQEHRWGSKSVSSGFFTCREQSGSVQFFTTQQQPYRNSIGWLGSRNWEAAR